MSESNICEQCGGIVQIEYTIGFKQCKPYKVRVNLDNRPDEPFRLCPGHPEFTQKHDGNLDAYLVRHHAETTLENQEIHIQGGLGDYEERGIYLDAKQSLSLLAWLIQEKPTLEQLAKEQEG